MHSISVLDCTLRDGGYINDFRFGRKVINEIIDGLSKASIDIIECGFLRSGCVDEDQTLYDSVEAIKKVIGEKSPNALYVAMIQVGAIGIDDIQDRDCDSIDGIRLTFHENEISDAIDFGRKLIDKGYKLFMQPVGTTSYDDQTLIDLVYKINMLKPFAFYMVDTLGKMYKNDLLHMFYLIDHNLDDRITLGFHSHNNLQMSFANAQELTQINTKRNLIIDASVLGMGRGAGNLNTELLVQYLNVNQGLKYDVFRIMNIMDLYIKPLMKKYSWGYDAAYYLAAITECHPNYASFLLNMQTLQIRDIGTILNGLSRDKRSIFDKEYIKEEYMKYMDNYVDDTDTCKMIKASIASRKILLLAPGKSFRSQIKSVNELKNTNEYYVVSINFVPKDIEIDTVFISNTKRFQNTNNLLNDQRFNVVVTSNIKNDIADFWIVNYSSYLNEDTSILDNAGLMCINLLLHIGAREFVLAGFDGFSANTKENFYEESLYFDVESERLAKLNKAMASKIELLKKQATITFLSETKYVV